MLLKYARKQNPIPLTKRSEFEPPTKWSNLAENKPFSEILEDASEIWYRVNWRLSEELFLFWYIWLKDNLVKIREFVLEMKTVMKQNAYCQFFQIAAPETPLKVAIFSMVNFGQKFSSEISLFINNV